MAKMIQTNFDKTYCYPNTHILKNKLNIQDADELRKAERELTSTRIHELEMESPIPTTFDANHLKALHKHIFQDLYDWAGEFRTVDIAKGNMFCRTMFLNDQLNDVFRQLRRDNYLKGCKTIQQMGEKLGYYQAEINAVHPFREGNGRTQRMFIKQLAKHNGYTLEYAKIPEGQMLDASIKSFNQDYHDLQQLLTAALTKDTPQPDRAKMAEERFGHIKAEPDNHTEYTPY